VIVRFILVIAVLFLGGRITEPQTFSSGSNLTIAELHSAGKSLLCVLSRHILECVAGTFQFSPQADGGGDGGDGSGGSDGTGSGSDGAAGGSDGADSGSDGTGSGSDGAADGAAGTGASDDGSADGVSGTAEGNSGNSDSDADGPSADSGTVGAPGDQGDPGDPGNTDDAADPAAVTDPTDPSTVSSLDNTEADVPTNDPALGLRGPGSSGAADVENGAAVDSVGAASPPVPALRGLVPGVGVDVAINAVIVSGARTPWEAIGRSSGVRNVIVTGGIIALGETALAKSAPGVTVGDAANPPEWLKFKPDLRYASGSVFPPVVPNVIDIRTISNSEDVIENPSN
jgi:hypothetical protein